MNKAKFYLGIDIGSTAVKAALRGFGHTAHHGLPRLCLPYQKRRDICYPIAARLGVCRSKRRKGALAATDTEPCIAGISVSAQGGSIFAADRNREPISDAVSWMDSRASDEADELYREFGEDIYRACGWRLSPLDDASKLLWPPQKPSRAFRACRVFYDDR